MNLGAINLIHSATLFSSAFAVLELYLIANCYIVASSSKAYEKKVTI